jgi:DNA (cytosine-5)-methyltransferase 1
MRMLSLFTGCGGFELGLEDCECAMQCEIDRDCNRVLRRQFPDTPRLDNVLRLRSLIEAKHARRIRAKLPVHGVDLVTGGFPCQDVSVAGRRAGLAGARSGLWFVFRRIIAILRPRWLLIENVPGLLSSHRGRDMGAILGAMGRLGYGWAYRSFDAQYFALAQRRDRVFIVGCLGNPRAASQVLFECDCLPWNHPPRRCEKSDLAGTIEAGSRVRGFRTEPGEHLVAFGGNNTTGPIDVATACNAKGGSGRMDFESETFVTHALRGAGVDATEDGTGRGTPLVPVAFDTTQITSRHNRSDPKPGDPCHPLQSTAHAPAIAYRTSGNSGVFEQGDKTSALNCGTDRTQTIIAFETRFARNGRGAPSDVSPPLTASEAGTHADSKPHVAGAFGVRRLTPRECERLQGFPDDWTRWDETGAEISDSARYRMLGNAVPVPVIRWIGSRLATLNSELSNE